MRSAVYTVLLVAALVPAAARAVARGDLLDEASRSEVKVEAQVDVALVAILSGDPAAADREVRAFEVVDVQREDAGLAPTGLTDDLRFLAAGLIPTRDARRLATQDVLDAKPDPVIAKLASHAFEADDDAAAADRLLSDDAHNRRASLLNDAIRPFGVFTGGAALAAINPFLLAGSALDSLATTVGNLWSYNRLSPSEREALVRYRTQLEREQHMVDAPEMSRAVRRLGRKRAEALCKETVELGEKALDADDLERARFYLVNAHRLPECNDATEKPLDKLAEALVRDEKRRQEPLWPVDEPLGPTNETEARDWQAMATATVIGDPGAMMATAQRFTSAHPDSDLEPGARFVVAVARDLGGHRAEARSALVELSKDDDSQVGREAAALLDSPSFTGLATIDAAESRHSRAVARYVLLGGFDGRSAVYGAAQLGAQGAQAASTLGVFNVIGMATRAWKAWRKDPVSNQEIIDRGEELLAREPTTPDAPEVHERLAKAYERTGNFERALLHYQATPAPDPDRVKKLQGKLADRLLEDIKGSPAESALLASLAEQFPDTDAAETARERLKDRPGAGDLPLDRDLLHANPQLLGPAALDLDPRLLDGDESNGELAERGVTLSPGSLKLELIKDGDDQQETRTLSDEQYARARSAAEQVLYTRLLTTDPNAGEVGSLERYVPVYVQGTVGESGLSVVPAIKLRKPKSDNSALYQ